MECGEDPSLQHDGDLSWHDALPTVGAAAVISSDIWLQELYNRLNSPYPLAVLLISIPVATAALLITRYRRPWATAVTRSALPVGVVAVGLYLAELPREPAWRGLLFLGLAAGTTWAALLLVKTTRERWRNITQAVLVAWVVLVISGPILARALAPRVVWPPSLRADAAIQPLPRESAVLVILFDELGAAASEPLAAVVAQTFPNYSRAAVRSVADMTAKVVPEMFVRRPFTTARPCSTTAVCDHGHALDFAQVMASRQDIDVVGFYHPYCSIQGLRWCRQVAPPADHYSPLRWWCAAERTTFGRLAPESPRCQALPLARAAAFRESIVRQIDTAPFWTQGGTLFVHLPIPHPPGATPGGSLAEHYAANLVEARQLLQRWLSEGVHRFGDRFAVVVFSDHALRYAGACRSTLYRHSDCTMPETYRDTKVPVIVGSSRWIDLGPLHSNAQIFDLLATENSSSPITERR
jgi:hypothetical protein